MASNAEFRAWTRKWGMVYPDSPGMSIDVHGQTVWQDSRDEECVTLMQFIGASDENKKKIWDGDVVHYTFDFDEPKKKQKRYVGFVRWNEEHCAFNIMKTPEDTNGLVFHSGDFLHVWVIGNIYENPELMTVEAPKQKPSLAGSRRKNKSE